MRPTRLRCALAIACAGWTAACARSPAPGTDSAIALVGGTILDGTGSSEIASGVLVYSDDTIRCVGTREECPIPEGADIRDLTGRYLTPGLIDAHVHFSQTGWLDGRPDGLDVRERYPYEELVAELRSNSARGFADYLCSGVTGVFDVGGFRWTIAMAGAAEDDSMAPHVRAAGPLISHAGLEILSTPAAGGQFIMLTSAETGRAGVRELASLGADAVKVWYLSPPDSMWSEIEARFRAVADEARAVGLPLLVHATELRAAKVAVGAGAFMLVHSVVDQPVDEEFLDLMKEHGTIYAPTLVVFRNWGRAVSAAVLGDTVPAWNDPRGCVDDWTEEKLRSAPELRNLVSDEGITPEMIAAGREGWSRQKEVMAQNLRRVHAAGVPIVLATDAGNPLTLHGVSVHDELAAMEAAGIPPPDLVTIGTRNGARAMGRPDIGTLATGHVADILVLSRDPRESSTAFGAIEAVIHKGVWSD